jgi:hypothetical protein
MLEHAIFPIISFNPDSKVWSCLGTGFFINQVGGFVTAKHIFLNDRGDFEKTMYGVHNTGTNYHLRPVKNSVVMHKEADLLIGQLGMRREKNKDLASEPSLFLSFDFKKLNKGDSISSFAFPNTSTTANKDNTFDFEFQGVQNNGEIIDFHKTTSRLKHRCYQTNMVIDGGASGGPVLRAGHIVGFNSTSMGGLIDGGEPISFITPIDFILDLKVMDKGSEVSIDSLFKNGSLHKK